MKYYQYYQINDLIRYYLNILLLCLLTFLLCTFLLCCSLSLKLSIWNLVFSPVAVIPPLVYLYLSNITYVRRWIDTARQNETTVCGSHLCLAILYFPIALNSMSIHLFCGQNHFMFIVKAVTFLGENGGLLIFLLTTHLVANNTLFSSTGKLILCSYILFVLTFDCSSYFSWFLLCLQASWEGEPWWYLI